jgi:iron uptake system EfeUOB component EfeO/EfeM
MGELNSSMSEGSAFSSLQDTESVTDSESTGKESGIDKAKDNLAKSKILKTAAQRNRTKTVVSKNAVSSNETDVEAGHKIIKRKHHRNIKRNLTSLEKHLLGSKESKGANIARYMAQNLLNCELHTLKRIYSLEGKVKKAGIICAPCSTCIWS